MLMLLLLLLPLQLLLFGIGGREAATDVLRESDIQHWATSLENQFRDIANNLAADQFEQSFYEKGVRAEDVGERMAKETLQKIKDRMQKFIGRKELHVQKIRQAAEESFENHLKRNYSCSQFMDHPYLRAAAVKKLTPAPVASVSVGNETREPPAVVTIIPVSDTKSDKCNEEAHLNLTSDPRLYGVETNRFVSTAHVPPNIYDASNDILNVANWSSVLDSVFIENSESDHALKWQYFGSTEGMFKIYPGIQWYIQTRNYSQKDTPVDFFDCRTQYWYLLAATYPKDMIVLIDNSGSMKGRRAIIANKTLTELLQTLTVNDFFNVIMFMNSSIKYLSPEFNRSMLQATERNKYRAMDIISEDEKKVTEKREFAPHGISDYRTAFTEAFYLLELVRTNYTALSSNGTQAIMLITDGAPEVYRDLFDSLNPERQVRVFTYLIGQEASDEANVREIACNNRGFFAQISTLADVKENVQQYIPVMARANAMDHDHFFVWTGVHRNQIKTQNPQAPVASHSEDSDHEPAPAAGKRGMPAAAGGVTLLPMPGGATGVTPTSAANLSVKPTSATLSKAGSGSQGHKLPQKIVIKTKLDSGPHIIQEEDPRVKNKLFSSVAQAAYDLRDNETLKIGTGNLVGVAGLDVPISHFERLGPAWELGPFAYIFMLTNNGHVLFHPEYMPLDNFGNVRMFYNNRDIAEIEFPADAEPLFNSPNYSLPLRVRMIKKLSGSDSISRMKLYENYNRVHQRDQKFFFTPIRSSLGNTETPFSLALALPWRNGRQSPQRVTYVTRGTKQAELGDSELQRVSARLAGNVTCEPMRVDAYLAGLSEYEFCEFNASMLALFNENPICAFGAALRATAAEQRRLKCDAEFLRRALVDALATQSSESIWMSNGPQMRLKFGASLFFLWSSTGFVRWYTAQPPLDADFIRHRRNASREMLYEKTIALNSFEERSRAVLVLSTPSSREILYAIKRNASYPRSFPVHATLPIRSRPQPLTAVGVVGVELDYTKVEEVFRKVTSTCSERGRCLNCSSESLRCYMVDTSGFVVVSEQRTDAGKAFDQVECAAMRVLINNGLFESVQTYDYQAICTRTTTIPASANSLKNPIKALLNATVWLVTQLFLILAEVGAAAMQAAVAAAQELLQRMSPEQCEEIERSRSERKQQLRDKIDAQLAAATLKIRKLELQQKTDFLKRGVVKMHCNGQVNNQEACSHLCKRLQEKFRPGVVADLLGSCPKLRVKQEACVLRRELATWKGESLWRSSSPMQVNCASLSFCQSSKCDGNSGTARDGTNGQQQQDAQLHVRPVSGTNLIFVAMAAAPGCKCRGCADIITTVELDPPVNFTEPLPLRQNPSWSQKTITLRDNDTDCSKRAARAANAQRLMLLLLPSLLLLLQLQNV